MSINHIAKGGLVDLDLNIKSLEIQGVPVTAGPQGGAITPFVPDITFPTYLPPDQPTITPTGVTSTGTIVDGIVTLSGQFTVNFFLSTPNGVTGVFTLPPELVSSKTGEGVVTLTGFDANFPTPSTFGVIGKGTIETDKLYFSLYFTNGFTTASLNVPVDCNWIATYDLGAA
jgi:hypothetical protein